MRLKRTAASRRWTSLAASLAMFALLCATLAYWAMQLLAPPVPIAPSGSLVDHRDAPDLASAARLFGQPGGGAAAAPPVALANIQVLGVAASTVRGSAVLVVDGKPPKAYMVGDVVAPGARLVEVRPDLAVVEQNGARVELVAPQRPSVAILSGGPARPDARGIAPTPPVPAVAAPAAAAPLAPPPGAGVRINGPILAPPPGAAPTAPSEPAPATPPEAQSGTPASEQAAATTAETQPAGQPAEPGPDGGPAPAGRP